MSFHKGDMIRCIDTRYISTKFDQLVVGNCYTVIDTVSNHIDEQYVILRDYDGRMLNGTYTMERFELIRSEYGRPDNIIEIDFIMKSRR
jgi:hypothetical protein